MFDLQNLIRMDKKEILVEKRSIKMSLRDHSHIKPKKFVEYDQYQEEKHIQSKSRRWWQKVNKKYFGHVSKNQLECLRNTIIQDYYLQIENDKSSKQSYFYRNLLSKNPKLFQGKNIKVLFQNGQTVQCQSQLILMTYYFSVKSDQERDQKQHIIEQVDQWQDREEDMKITYMKNQQFQILYDEQIEEIVKCTELTLNKSTTDIDFLTQCNYFELTKYQYYPCELDRQIDLWTQELKKTNFLNGQTWGNIIRNYQQQLRKEHQAPMVRKIRHGYHPDEDTKHIQRFLSWQHNLVNFKCGFSDKNQEMLAQALQGMWVKQNQQKNMGDKKKFFKTSFQNLIVTKSQLINSFQTDCKICFSTYVSQKNKVIYCDNCNQSFHEQCYGIQNLNQDPQSKFYCDHCLHLRSNNKTSKNPMLCQVCLVPFSPLKMFGRHFFHPSCLFINNMLRPKLGNLELHNQMIAQDIITCVKRFELSNTNNQCQYCLQTCTLGIRFKCSYSNCNRHFHTLCAYLNSAVFNIRRNGQKLQIQVKCSYHFPQRDHLRQTYLRRFFCNYKNTSDLNQVELGQIYREQMQAVRDFKLEATQKKYENYNITKPKHRKTDRNRVSCKSYTLIDLNSDQDQQNTIYQQNGNSLSSSLSSSKNSVPYKQTVSLTAYQLKMDLQRITDEYAKLKKKSSISQFQNKSLSKISSYLYSIGDKQLNFEHQCLKQIFGLQGQLNTNSNDSQSNQKKIIYQ